MKFTVVLGGVLIAMGILGEPSGLSEPVNTATMVFLFGVLLFTLSFKGD